MSAKGKTGVLLVNLGTPDAPQRGAVYRYLRQFLLDPRVIDYPWLPRQLLVQGIIAPFRSGSSARLYRQLWTPEGSPLKVYGKRLAEGVQSRLGGDYAVELAMRYQQPSISSAINRLLNRQVSEIVVLSLFPQYASATTGSVFEEVMRVLKKEEVIPPLRFVSDYYDFEPMIEVFASNAAAFDLASYDHLIFSYHGLPQRQLRKADRCNHCLHSPDCCQTICAANQFCYSAQCHATTHAIAQKLNLPKEKFTTTFQSRLGPEKWAQPYTSQVIESLAAQGAKRLLVFSPAFVADCLETLIEIKVEYLEMFEKLGGEHLDLVPSLNDDPRWINAVADMVRANAHAR
ncbi:MAG: ferrochelatase [Saprospiraceae bacterium]|nr:ferrochelatase [Saprospiraceae bacterium]